MFNIHSFYKSWVSTVFLGPFLGLWIHGGQTIYKEVLNTLGIPHLDKWNKWQKQGYQISTQFLKFSPTVLFVTFAYILPKTFPFSFPQYFSIAF